MGWTVREAEMPSVQERVEGRRIFLTDVDRPDEPLEVGVLDLRSTVLRVIVPNTQVTFDLRPHGGDNCLFEGTLGGRLFAFDARTLVKSSTARK